MLVQNSILDLSNFKDAFSDYYFKFNLDRTLGDEAQVFSAIEAKLQEVGFDAVDFLKYVDSIAEKDLQDCCRAAAIAQMYGVCSISHSSRPYVEIPSYAKNIVLIHLMERTAVLVKDSTAVLDGYGNILIPEKQYATHRGCFYPGLFSIKELSTGKYGLLTADGRWILPCVFDFIKLHLDGCHEFILNVPVTLESGRVMLLPRAFKIGWVLEEKADKKLLEYLIKKIDSPRRLIGRSADGVLFWIEADESNIARLRPLLAKYCVSKEQLEQLLAGK